MTLTSSNTGTAASALNIVDYNEDVYLIREGQIKNYIYSDVGADSGTWVKQTSRVDISGEFIFVTQSGMEIWVDISGDLVQLTSGTGPIRAVTLSGSIVGISGQQVQLTSGTGPIQVVALSGSVVGISGQQVQLTSGTGPIQSVALSGSVVGISGQLVQLTSGTGPIQSVALSGSVVGISGQLVQLTSGTGPIQVVTLSGSIVNASGAMVTLQSGTSIVGNFFDYAADSSTIIPAGFRVMNLSGVEPITIALKSGTGPIQATVLSGSITAIVTVSLSGATITAASPTPSVLFAGASNAPVSAWLAVTTPVWFEHLTIHQNSAPTTSGATIITLKSISGAVYDTTLYSDGTLYQDLFYEPQYPIALISGEGLFVAYPNTDNRNIGVRIVSRP